MIKCELFTSESLETDGSVEIKRPIPQGAIIRRVYILGSESGNFDWALTDATGGENEAVYDSGTGVAALDKKDVANPYMPLGHFYVKVTNKDATAQTFTVKVIFEEPAVSY